METQPVLFPADDDPIVESLAPVKPVESLNFRNRQRKPGITFLKLILVMIFLLTGCTKAPVTLFPSPTSSIPHPTGISTPTFQATDTFAPSSTHSLAAPLEAAWLTYTDPALRLEFRYPNNWQPESSTRYSGADGYFEISELTYPASEFDSFATLCVLEANLNKPLEYGAFPYITSWQKMEAGQQFTSGYGCTVTPGDERAAGPRDQSILFARFQPAWPGDALLVLRADSAHFEAIVDTLQFTGSVTPTPHPVNVYDAPACQVPLANPGPTISHSAGLVITEYPLVNSDCDPMAHFDGFQAHVRSLGLDNWSRYSDDLVRRGEEANRILEPFGYHLAARQKDIGNASPRMIMVYDLYQGDEQLKTDLNNIGPISVSTSGKDFILWVQNSDTSASTEVRSLRSLEWWKQGFNTAWVGPDLIKYEYDMTTHLFPVGAPSQAIVYSNDQPISSITIPQAGPAGFPLQWLYAWEGHWVLEVENVVIIDGELQNPKLGYSEMFNWQLVNDKPFYFFRKGDSFGVSYAGQTLPGIYNDIMHGQLCCDYAAYSISSLTTGAWFYARREGTWYLVSVLTE